MATAAGLVWDETQDVDEGRGVEELEIPRAARTHLTFDALTFDATEKRQRSRERLEPAGVPVVRGFLYDGARCGRAVRAGLSRRGAYRGPLPMEELGVFRKRIGNQGLRRRSSAEGKSSWRTGVAVGLAALVMGIVMFGPRAWLRQSGYRVAEMMEQRQELSEIQYHLRVRQAQLSDLKRVSELAAAKGLEAPPPGNYTWQDVSIPATPSQSDLARTFKAPPDLADAPILD